MGTQGGLVEWTRILAYITGTVDRELLLRNEYLAAETGFSEGGEDQNGPWDTPIRRF